MSRSRRTDPYNTAKGLQTRLEILHAAGKVFATKGYEAATLRDVAKEADIVVSAIIHHFGTKDDLYVEVMRHFILESKRWDYIFESIWTDKTITPQSLGKIIGDCIHRYMYKRRPDEPPFENRLAFRLATDDVPMTHHLLAIGGLEKVHQRLFEVCKKAYPKLTKQQMLDWRSAFYAMLMYPNMMHRILCVQSGWSELPADFYKHYAKKMTAQCCALLQATTK